MASKLTIEGFPDNQDPRFFQIVQESYEDGEDMIPRLYTVKDPTQPTERWSSLTGMGLFSEFTGTVTWDGPDQGYAGQSTFKEYAKGIQVERALILYDQFDMMDKQFKLLGESARDTRQIEAAETFVSGFGIDPGYTHDEGIALFSDAHTSPRPGVVTTTGFDNLSVAPFSPTGLKAIFIQLRRFRKTNGQPIDGHRATAVVGPPELEQRSEEIFGTMRGLDEATGTKNVLENLYKFIPWVRLTNITNYFVVNEKMMKENLFWFDKVKPEFSRMEEFDNIIAKYRGYYVSHRGRDDWRFGVGVQVS